MRGNSIILGKLSGSEAAALIRDGRLEDLFVSGELPAPGTIYRAIADRPMKGQGGLFLRSPDGNVFLRQVKGISPGQTVLVQVTGYAEPGKAIPVTRRIVFKSRYAIVTPEAPGLNISRQIKDESLRDSLEELAHDAMLGSDMGLILRSICADAEFGDVHDDITLMREIAEKVMSDTAGAEPETLVEGDGPHALAWREWTEPGEVVEGDEAFETMCVLDALEELRGPSSPLPGGGSLWVEPTRALVAVDINTGGATSPAAGLKANLAAARELPRQLRLRGLGGQIVMDCAPMPKKDRRQIEGALRSALKEDPVETTLVGWSGLGHFEMHRKRDRVALEKVLR